MEKKQVQPSREKQALAANQPKSILRQAGWLRRPKQDGRASHSRTGQAGKKR